MNFFDLAGHEGLKKTIAAAFDRGRLPHAVLIDGGSEADRDALTLTLAAAVQCTGAGEKPCGVCEGCRKVRRGIHPDVETVESADGAIKAEAARDLRSAALLRPNEGARHVFWIRGADRMNVTAQNILLKTLEEPPGTAMFLLTAENPGALLITVRSRCVRYRLEESAQEAEVPETAERFFALLEGGDALEIARFLRGMEKTAREDFAAFLAGCVTLTARALRGKYLPDTAATKLPAAALVRLEQTFRETEGDNKRNCGVGHLCGRLAVTCWEALN